MNNKYFLDEKWFTDLLRNTHQGGDHECLKEDILKKATMEVDGSIKMGKDLMLLKIAYDNLAQHDLIFQLKIKENEIRTESEKIQETENTFRASTTLRS